MKYYYKNPKSQIENLDKFKHKKYIYKIGTYLYFILWKAKTNCTAKGLISLRRFLLHFFFRASLGAKGAQAHDIKKLKKKKKSRLYSLQFYILPPLLKIFIPLLQFHIETVEHLHKLANSVRSQICPINPKIHLH